MNADHTMSRGFPSSEQLQLLEDRIYEFNSTQTGQDDRRQFSLLVRNDQEQIVAGLSGWSWAKACEITALWMHSSFRKSGYGRSLLESAKQEARARGCKVVLLSNYSFQASAFYHGYELAWQLEQFPPGYQSCHLVKKLEETGAV